jgi:hypothetical protein
MMQTTEIRPLPASRTVVMRSSFFALAKLGAKLLSFNETQGIIIAQIAPIVISGLELFEQNIEISVTEHENSSMVKVNAPNSRIADLLRLTAAYIVGGAKAIKDDAHMQWAEMLREEGNRRQQEEKRSTAKKNLDEFLDNLSLRQPPKPSRSMYENENAEIKTIPIVLYSSNRAYSSSSTERDPRPGVLRLIDPSRLDLVMPLSPGMIIKNRGGQLFEIQVDSIACPDRAAHLNICPYCSTVNFQGCWFCFRCGKQLTVKGAIEEIKKQIVKNSNLSIKYALLGLIPSILSFALVILLYALIAEEKAAASILKSLLDSFDMIVSLITEDRLSAALPLIIFVALPSFLLGRQAVSNAQNAFQYFNLNFYPDQSGRIKAAWGQAIGYLEIYLAIGMLLYIVLHSYMNLIGI